MLLKSLFFADYNILIPYIIIDEKLVKTVSFIDISVLYIDFKNKTRTSYAYCFIKIQISGMVHSVTNKVYWRQLD